MPSFAIPAPDASIPATAPAKLDQAIDKLQRHKGAFARLSLDRRISLLDGLADGVMKVAEEWVKAALGAKGIHPGSGPEGEEWLAGPMATVRNIRFLQKSLAEVRDHGAPLLPSARLSTRSDGRLVARVFPDRLWDQLLYSGITGDVWMQPGVTAQNLPSHQASAYRDQDSTGKVSLVLGAGNVASIGPMDALYKFFVENQVVLLKMNPVNEYLGPFILQAFGQLAEEGWFEVVYGGAEVGAYLVAHPGIEEIHITGSDATHDAIVWGTGKEQAERKAARTPKLEKRISSELGNVTPVVIVPGEWSEKELQYQAENIVSMVVNNASFNCNAAKLLVLAEGWDQREVFTERIRSLLSDIPTRKAYYPGARSRWQEFVEAHRDHATLLGTDDNENVPWTYISGLDANDPDEICFRQEPFCGLLHEVTLPSATAADFLDSAAAFCNERVWGSLAISLLIDPRTRKTAEAGAALDRALDQLRYGSIAINTWAALAYALCSTTWGAHPGHPLDDIQSGQGVVHNTYLFDKPQKTIIDAPFRIVPKPPWFPTHARGHRVARKIAYFEAEPGWSRLPGIIFDAARS